MGLVQVFAELLELLEGLLLVLYQVLAALALDPLLEVASRILLGLDRVKLVHYGVESLLLLQDYLGQGLLGHEVDDLLPVRDLESSDGLRKLVYVLLEVGREVLPPDALEVSVLLVAMIDLGADSILDVVVMVEVLGELIVADQILEDYMESVRDGFALHFVQVSELSLYVHDDLSAFGRDRLDHEC